MRSVLASLIEVSGGAAVVYGMWLLAPWLAFVVGGVLAILSAAAVEGGDK